MEVIFKWLYSSYRRTAHFQFREKYVKPSGHQNLGDSRAHALCHVMHRPNEKKPQTVKLAASPTQNLICLYRQTGEAQNKSQALVSITDVCDGWSAMLLIVFEQPRSSLPNPLPATGLWRHVIGSQLLHVYLHRLIIIVVIVCFHLVCFLFLFLFLPPHGSQISSSDLEPYVWGAVHDWRKVCTRPHTLQ